MRNYKEIIKFIEDLVNVHEITCLEQLSEVDRDWLTALYMQSERESDKFCCITDAKNAEELRELFIRFLFASNSLYHCTEEDILRDDLVETLKKNAFEYYKKDIEELFQGALLALETEKHGDYVKVRAQDNGEPLAWGNYS